MRDFLIKLLGGYKYVLVEISSSRTGVYTRSHIITFYPMTTIIWKMKRGYVKVTPSGVVTVESEGE